MIRALFGQKPAHETVPTEELNRLRQIEQIATRMAKQLDQGLVDYEQLEDLKALLNGQRSERA